MIKPSLIKYIGGLPPDEAHHTMYVMEYLRTTDAVIAALGGTMAVSRLVGADPTNVSSCRGRKKTFPARWYFVMSGALAPLYRADPTLWKQVVFSEDRKVAAAE